MLLLLTKTPATMICLAPDVSRTTTMMDRIKQIGDGNEVDPAMMVEFEVELKAQILCSYIRSYDSWLTLRCMQFHRLRLSSTWIGRGRRQCWTSHHTTQETRRTLAQGPTNWERSRTGRTWATSATCWLAWSLTRSVPCPTRGCSTMSTWSRCLWKWRDTRIWLGRFSRQT